MDETRLRPALYDERLRWPPYWSHSASTRDDQHLSKQRKVTKCFFRASVSIIHGGRERCLSVDGITTNEQGGTTQSVCYQLGIV